MTPRGRGPQPEVERADRQAGTSDDAGTPGIWTLLWALLGSAVVWSVHFGVVYALVAAACSTGWRGGAREALVAAGVLALALVVASGRVAWRRWRIARAVDRPEDDHWDARMGERTARVSYLMVSGLFLSLLFGLGLVYETMVVYMVPLCEPGVSA